MINKWKQIIVLPRKRCKKYNHIIEYGKYSSEFKICGILVIINYVPYCIQIYDIILELIC